VISCGNSMGKPGERYDFPGGARRIAGDGYMLFRLAPDRYLLAGALRCRTFLPQWELCGGAFSLTLLADCRTLAPGETLGPDTFILIEDDSLYKVMRRYSEWIDRFGSRAPRRVPTVWRGFGMWGNFTGERLLTAFRQCRESYADDLNILQVDAGYCAWGDWIEVYPHVFPEGVPAFVEKVRQEGGAHTGWWAAPFLAELESRLFREHPGYFLKKGDGSPYLIYSTGKTHGVLDFSQDEVCDWWRNIVTVMRRKWGITYFKFDFLTEELIPIRGRNSMTPNERYQRFFDVTNEVCGDDTYILGCNAAYSATFGSCDAFRLGADIAATWPRMMGTARPCAGHAVFHLHPAAGDCDYFELRGPDTPSLPGMLGHTRGTHTMDEAKMWAQFQTLFGRIILMTDDPSALEEERKALIRQVLRTGLNEELFTMDPFCGDCRQPPSFYLARRGGATELHIFNWSSEEREFRVFDADGSLFHSRTLKPHSSSADVLTDRRSFAELASALRPDSPEMPRSLFTPELETFPTEGQLTALPLGAAAKYSISPDRNGGLAVHEGTYGPLAGKRHQFCGIPFDLTADRAVQYGYREPGPVKLPVGSRADRLYFLHSTMYPTKGDLLTFTVRYADGECVEDRIALREDIGNSNFFYSMPWSGARAKVAWCDAYTGDVLYAFRWENPRPQSEIVEIGFSPLLQMGEWNLLGVTKECK